MDIMKRKNVLPEFVLMKYELNYKFWENLNLMNKTEIINILRIFFPNVANSNNLVNPYENEFIFDKLINISKEYVDQHLDWPDETYIWDPPKNQKIGRDVIPGMKDAQHLIWKHQHPMTCENKEFIVIPTLSSGFGSCIHYISALLAEAIEKDKILIWGNEYYSWNEGPYCNFIANTDQKKYILEQEKRRLTQNPRKVTYQNKSKMKGFDCFFSPLTNCSIKNKNQINDYDFSSINFKLVPSKIKSIVEKLKIPKDLAYFYWRLCSTTYIIRYNELAKEWMKELEDDYLINPVSNYDVSIYVRHGDKLIEMQLVSDEQYVSALNVIQKILGKENLNVFLSTEDPRTIQWFKNNTNYSLTYFDFTLGNYGIVQAFNLGDVLTRQMLANLKHSLFSKFVVGTLSSNWNRLIQELRMTTAGYANNYYFEVGDHVCVSLEHCKLINETLHMNW